MTEKKPRLVEVTDPEERKAIMLGGLDAPAMYEGRNHTFWVLSDELRAWREARSYNSGDGK